MKTIFTVAALAATMAAGSAQAAVIFSENFDDELVANGGQQLNFSNFDQLTVTEQSVDLIQSGGFGITCETAACVDLDGSTGSGGTLTSDAINFVAGVSYELTFRVSGNQRGAADDTFSFGLSNGLLSSETLSSGDGFADFTLSFAAVVNFSDSFFISDQGDDNFGVILDSITLTDSTVSAVPLPAGLPLLLVGLGGFGLLRRTARKS